MHACTSSSKASEGSEDNCMLEEYPAERFSTLWKAERIDEIAKDRDYKNDGVLRRRGAIFDYI